MLNNTIAERRATGYAPLRAISRVAEHHRVNVERARKVGMFTEREIITSEHALHIIERHAPEGSNRSISASKIAALTAQMAAGLWNPNSHQGIAFRVDGVLADGQHRLTACVNSGQPFTTLVTYGQPADVFAVLDQGTQRTGAHILQAAGLHVPSVNHMAAAARQLEHIEEWRLLAIKGGNNSSPSGGVQPAESGVKKAARELGVDPKTVRNAAKIANLPPEVKEQAKAEGWSQTRALAAAAPSKPAPAIKNAFESEEDWKRSLYIVWNRGAQDWRERALEAMDRPVFDRT